MWHRPRLAGHGAAAAAAAELGDWPHRPAAADLLRRHGLLRAADLHAMAVAELPDPVAGEWPDAAALAARVLARLPPPFTTAQARQALGTTWRMAIPLLEYLDAAGATERLADDRRRLRARPASVADPGIDHLAT